MYDSPPSQPSERDQVLREVQVMLRYALSKGKEFDDKTRAAVSAVEHAEPSPIPFDTLMAAHTALAKLVAPATPASLEATEPAPGLFGFLRRPPLIRWLIISALVSAIGFISTAVDVARPTKDTTEKAKSSAAERLSNALAADEHPHYQIVALAAGSDEPPAPNPWKTRANWFFAAALGASFYGLFTAHEYVKTRTFDPSYNSLYLIRFVLGIISGLILGMLSPAFSDPTSQKLGPSVIALLGGFSAEAVNQILQRFVDILLAAIRGDNSAAAKTKASQTAQQELLSIAGDSTLSPAVRDRVHEAIRKVGQ